MKKLPISYDSYPKQHFRWDLDWVSIGRLANIGRYFYNIGPITVDDCCSSFQPFNIGPIQLQYWEQLNFFWEFLTFHPQLYLFLISLIVNYTLFYSRTHFKHLNFLYSCKFGPINGMSTFSRPIAYTEIINVCPNNIDNP